jgi:hypothetical protein
MLKDGSQRFVIAVLAGIILNLAFTFFIQIACWGSLISVIAAVYLAKVKTPRDAAIIGAVVFVPSSVVLVIQAIMRQSAIDEVGLPLTILAGFVGLLVGVVLGGLFGFVVGKVLEFVKDNQK